MIIVLILNLMVLLSIAFFTLFERKILSHIQIRIGPNKVYFMGILQPIFDGMKLFMKQNVLNFNINKIMFMFFPFFLLLLMLFYWLTFTFNKLSFFSYSMIYIMMISSFSVYGILGSGWSSNSIYSMLGAYRSVAQVISYEVGMIFMIMCIFSMAKNYNLSMLLTMNNLSHLYLFGFMNLFMIWFIIMLAELNRAPFDFAESESELVSGFNVEYGSTKFAFLFLSEYGNIIFMMFVTMLMFINENMFILVFLLYLVVWVRGVFPRYRYDNLMYLNWKVYLPFILLFFMLLYMFSVLY